LGRRVSAHSLNSALPRRWRERKKKSLEGGGKRKEAINKGKTKRNYRSRKKNHRNRAMPPYKSHHSLGLYIDKSQNIGIFLRRKKGRRVSGKIKAHVRKA